MSAHTQMPQPGERLEMRLETGDNRHITLRLFEAPHPRAVVIVAGAMGVGQHCYEKFARFLQANGATAITFDYFGTGASLDGHLRDCPTDIIDWGRFDAHALIEFARARYPDADLRWVGHSVGGQLLGMTPNINQLERAVTVACGSGYWRENSPPTKRVAWLLWYGLGPALVATLGYFPGTRLNMVGDLPPNVMRQWRRWCLNPDYAVGAEGATMADQFAGVRVPITGVAFTDDEMMSRRNVESLHGFFRGTAVDLQHIAPQAVGEQRIGHLGWFRERYRDALWQDVLLPRLLG
ncbi:serine aminopeptidase domain-containing protein [Marinobacter sp. JSM 1782161]|uniref:alpha/beta hydrolase family protein n=1 Tax=Marinobacter sp. JSM 1782161 TaxID=2685906 RepID=UPI001403A251|nr:alpha/beta hydrolase [Marinobacter sp. JSM 1782161]